MARVERIEVKGLFGYTEHELTLRLDAPTVITAPNGAGKTHVLMLLRAALSLDIKSLGALPFSEFSIEFSDGKQLFVERTEDLQAGPSLRFIAKNQGTRVGEAANFRISEIESLEPDLPSFIRPLGNGRWLDARSGRPLSTEALERRYRLRIKDRPADLFVDHPEILELCPAPYPVLIDTKRLDGVVPAQVTRYEDETFNSGEGIVGASRIQEYMNELRTQVTEARRSSIQATQSADLSFAARALAAANQAIKEGDLRDRYNEIVGRYENLSRNALATGEAPLQYPPKTTPTVRRILNVFLDDWEKRLEPLLPLNEKIMALREILDTKLEQSGKTTSMSPRGDLVFRTTMNRRIRVARLSSGEQHLVALFTLLLFSAERGSLVLIDEPEISLHAAWKHAFLDDISRVAKLADLQIVLATHSTAIINGRWDLTEELSFSPFHTADDSVVNVQTDSEESDDTFD